MRVIINKSRMQTLLGRVTDRNLDQRAERILVRLQETVPQDTGALAASLRVEKERSNGKNIYRIVSDDPQLRAILKGTLGPYRSLPPWGAGTDLGGWAQRHGFVTRKSQISLARHVATHGTKPAGSYDGHQDWIQEAIREVNR